MEFTKEELEELWSILEAHGYTSSTQPFFDKIQSKYKYCHICGKLFLHEEYQAHYDSEFNND